MYCSQCGAEITDDSQVCSKCEGHVANVRQRMVSFGEAFKLFWTANWTCKGRASRSEYWFGQLSEYICIIGLLFVLSLALFASGVDSALKNNATPTMNGSVWIALIVLIVVIFAFFALLWCDTMLLIRRLHDSGRTGWWLGGQIIAGMITQVMCTAAAITCASTNYWRCDNWISLSALLLIVLCWILAVAILIFKLVPSEKKTNRYGPIPYLVEHDGAPASGKGCCSAMAGVGCLLLLGIVVIIASSVFVTLQSIK